MPQDNLRDVLREVLQEELEPLRVGFGNMTQACIQMVGTLETLGAKLIEIEDALTKPAGPSEAVDLLRKLNELLIEQATMMRGLAAHIGMDFEEAVEGSDAGRGEPH